MQFTFDELNMSIMDNFIETNKNIKICPNKKCKYLVKAQNSIAKEIICKCGLVFCFSCLKESHIPCNCEMAKLFLAIDDEMTSRNKINLDNEIIKQCPNCETKITKYKLGPHITCKDCNYQFCWNCLEKWGFHNFENCHKNNKETNKFIKYYNIYKIHENNDKFIESTLKKNIETSKNELINKTLVYDDVKFLDDALNLIFDCNRILKYTFIFHCFLALNSNVNVFEYTFENFQIQYNEFLELIESDKISSIINLSGEIFNKKFIEFKEKILSLIDLLNKIKKF